MPPAAAHPAILRGLALAGALLLGGCTTTSLVLGVAGVATDTSLPLAIAKHLHAKITENDPTPCHALDSVRRALSPRCGDYTPGRIDAKDVHTAAMQVCPLTVAARDPALWPVLPELLAKGAQPERCAQSPLVALAEAEPCPDFAAASPAVRESLAWLATADARAIHHDVMRLLSCPRARTAGLDHVLYAWRDAGALAPSRVGFGVLGALHPDALDSDLSRALEADGHTALAGLGAYSGRRAPGFEAALREAHWSALDWWLLRRPELANSVPPRQGAQLTWRPLARVLVPSFVERPEQQAALVRYLISRGADPRQRMPFDATRSVLAYAQGIKSPLAALMEQPEGLAFPPPPGSGTTVASGGALPGGRGTAKE